MLLFRPRLAELLLSGAKTQTRRRRVSRPARPGSVHKCYTRPPWMQGEPFAEVFVSEVRRERCDAITEEDARAEGFAGREEFLRVVADLYGPESLSGEVWVLVFERVNDSAQRARAVA